MKTYLSPAEQEILWHFFGCETMLDLEQAIRRYEQLLSQKVDFYPEITENASFKLSLALAHALIKNFLDLNEPVNFGPKQNGPKKKSKLPPNILEIIAENMANGEYTHLADLIVKLQRDRILPRGRKISTLVKDIQEFARVRKELKMAFRNIKPAFFSDHDSSE